MQICVILNYLLTIFFDAENSAISTREKRKLSLKSEEERRREREGGGVKETGGRGKRKG